MGEVRENWEVVLDCNKDVNEKIEILSKAVKFNEKKIYELERNCNGMVNISKQM
jgi:hypothetical protein